MEPKPRNLALAIGLNLLLPGIGYMYMGKPVVGVLGCLLVVGVLFTTSPSVVLATWLGFNAIMAIDMYMLHNRRQKQIAAATMKKCPHCAEMIQLEAKVCRYCQRELVPAVSAAD
jgi:hypothetical protein